MKKSTGKLTGVVVPLVLGLVGLLLPEVGPVSADAVGDPPVLVGQGGAEHAVHGTTITHLQAAAQPTLVLLHQHTMSGLACID